MKTELRESPILVIMRPTESCNLQCLYCYNAISAPQTKMSAEILHNAIKSVLSHFKKVVFLWHGGECTLMGIDFLRQALQIQRRYKTEDHKIINEIQTNGTLLNKEWIDFFAENKFYVGVSIDGPACLNDAVRLYEDGRGTYEDILRNIILLKKKGIVLAGICVLARHNIDHLDEVVDFYKEQGIPLNINPFVGCGRGKVFRKELAISPEQYAEKMMWLFDKWFVDPSVKIYEFWKIVKSMFTGYNNICCYSGECSRDYLSICPTGDVFPCGRWAETQSFCMGNVNKDSMECITQSRPVIQILKRQELIGQCRNCLWFEICHGGCPHTAYVYDGTINTPDYYCHGRKKLFPHVYNAIKKEISVCSSKP